MKSKVVKQKTHKYFKLEYIRHYEISVAHEEKCEDPLFYLVIVYLLPNSEAYEQQDYEDKSHQVLREASNKVYTKREVMILPEHLQKHPLSLIHI